ncbi:MAG TPA: hypothetical protein VNE38_01305 [Ktedonobacteraceae bacterium]|nr:hypothetical protein [Ktedonobacteraceae bacterium]
MQTQNRDTADLQAKAQRTGNSKPRVAWLAGLGAFIVVLLVIGTSITIFTLVGQHQAKPQPPVSKQWKQVQSGYLFYSIQAAPSNPAVLYACTTTLTAISNGDSTGFIILRSADFGDHWQSVGSNISGSYCDLAINPTNADDIYAISANPGNASAPTVLKHSTDGGKTWAAITPELRVTGNNSIIPWSVQQLHFDGQNLYGVQWIMAIPLRETPQTPQTPTKQPTPTFLNRIARLVMSADGGHTWTIIDGQLTAQGLAAQGYVLDPAHPGTIYEMAGHPLFPVAIAPTPTSDVAPIYGINQQLFKTTDNGASWQSLLTSLPYGSQVQLASDNSQIIYVGGIRGPLPLAAQSGQPQTQSVPSYIGAFHLQVSTDGGANWQQVPTSADEQNIQSWFVSADGHVYTSPTMSYTMPGTQPTITKGTAVPATPKGVSSTPLPVSTVIRITPDIQVPAQAHILSFDASSKKWSQVTTPPTTGNLIEVTPTGTRGGAILWFMGVQDAQYALYRYTV